MKRKIMVVAALFLLVAPSIFAAGLSSARAVGMGGAHMGLAKGVSATLYNPANLGLSDHRERGLEIAGAGLDIRNNSFTLKDYNQYSGAFLTDEDKSLILGKIPAEGLKLSAEAEAGALCISLGSYSLAINGFAATEINLGKDALELFLNGNGLNEAFSLSGMYSEAIAYGTISLSYGKSILRLGTKQLALGASLKYIRGFAYEEVTEIYGGVVTLATGFDGEGTMIARTSSGGSGYSLDLGTSLRISDDYTAGLAISNIINSISWSNETQEHGYYFRFDALTLENMDNDSLIVSDDYSIDIPAFKTRLPPIMKVGIAKTSGKFIWAVDWTQGFRLAAASSTKPEISVGTEYRLFSFLPTRIGYSAGGGKGSILSLGLGIDLSLFHIDLAVSNNGTFNISNSQKIHFALATGFRF